VKNLAITAHSFPTRTLTVDDAYVNPPPEVTERITREAEELAKIYRESATDRLWTEPFVRPVSEDANSAFGSRSVFNGEARSPHSGADFRSPAGTPVHAPNRGRVVLAKELYFTGNTVIIDHGLGLFSLFAHFSAIDVAAGETVTTGQVVGNVGATGRVTGPHLHWGLRLDGARVDPLSLLASLGEPAK
jgi:murein DD-endopeptidase MepM/ murein hydrolase activator NlpD